MRGTAAEGLVPHRLVVSLPGMFQADEFTCRFVSAFDAVVSPVFETLDCLGAYLDPDTAPADFLDWLASWFGLVVDATWPEERRRNAMAQVVDLYRWRGTVRGLRAHVSLYLGPDVELAIEEDGGVVWSPTPGHELPGDPVDAVRVIVQAPDGADIDVARLRALVRAVTPAHLEVTVVTGDAA